MAKRQSLAVPVRVISESPRRLVPPLPSPETGGNGSGPEAGISPTPSPILIWTHPEWSQRFPWLAQGTTGRSPGRGKGDFRLFGEGASSEAAQNWDELAAAQGFPGVSHARQVHGDRVLLQEGPVSGLSVGPDADGHVSARPGAFMAVTVADCVPVFVVDPHRRAVAVLHAGWRGIVAGILEAGISRLTENLGSRVEDLLVHLGPAICGSCYEVGSEVHVALGLADPGGPEPVDLRGVLTRRALDLGVIRAHVTRSSFCSLCGASPFFSHRGGATQRQVGFMGIRTAPTRP